MKFRSDIVIFNLALLLMGLSALWFYSASESLHRRRTADLTPPSPSKVYSPTNPEAIPPNEFSWEEPPPQSWDEKAIFEIFSPPKIYYNRDANTFVLDPPLKSSENQKDFGLALVALSRLPYRLQYRGFAGQEGDYHILLRNQETGAYLRVRAGDVLAEEGVSIISFEVDRRMANEPEGSPVLHQTVRLQLFDARLGEKITLGPDIRYRPQNRATFRTTGPNPETFTLETGKTYLAGGMTYLLGEVEFERKSARVQKKNQAAGIPEWRTLIMDKSDFSENAASIPGNLSERTETIVQENLPKSVN